MVDLLGETPEQSGKAKRAKKKAESDGAVTRLWAVYAVEFHQKWGADVKPIITSPGRAGRHLKDLKNAIGEAETAQLIQDFFASRDPQVTRTNYTIEDIFQKAQYLRLAARRETTHQDVRTAANVDAAQRAMRKR